MDRPIKCDSCGLSWGSIAKDGVEVFQAYGIDSNVCTLCSLWYSREGSRRYDYEQNRAVNEGRKSGG